MADNSGVGTAVTVPNQASTVGGDDMATPAKRTTAPSFQFYPSDFLASSKVDDMSMTERGIYITLLCKCWLDNGLPNDMRRLAKMVGMKQPQFERVWSNGLVSECFHLAGGKFHNKRLDIERQKQKANRQRQSDNAKAGWQKRGTAAAMPPHQSGNARAESREETSGVGSSVLQEERKGDAPIDQWLFQVQNGLYPGHRVTRDLLTAQAFTEAMQTFPNGPFAAWGVFQDTLTENCKSHEWRVKGYIPWLRNYITTGQWQNDPHPPEAPVGERMTKATSKTIAAIDEIMKEPA